MEETILTLHPQGKQGANISRAKYDVIRGAILETLDTQGTVTFSALTEAVSEQLQGTFDGSISWYVTTVKLDMEARRLIERVPGSSPQELQLVVE